MDLHGHNIIGGSTSAEGETRFRATDPAQRTVLDTEFHEASPAEVDGALRAAERAVTSFGSTSPEQRAGFLRSIGDELVAAGNELLRRAHLETALPMARLEGERARTVGQLRLFADLLEEGSWVDARIDTGDAARTPAPKPDVRRMLVPLGPVVVFGASNFPLAFSVPGGDTASALAAGCPVVCKAHPAHPGTSELAARAIARAADANGITSDVFSLLHGWSHDVGLAMVRHPFATAVGFTGSLRGGRALFDAAAAREVPIPVYAEMGSVNPIFLLPSALRDRGLAMAQGLAASITVGVGQFCTNPGVVVGERGDALESIVALLSERLGAAEPGVMLYDQLARGLGESIGRAVANGAALVSPAGDARSGAARPSLLRVSAPQFIADATLREEMFGPVSMIVEAGDHQQLLQVAEAMEGQLTATIQGTDAELIEYGHLVRILQRKVGRLLFNGFPTGVEVGAAMHHGGPYPASSDSRTTSVGTAAIERFVRPLAYQNFPDAALPPALRSNNELGIWRIVNGVRTRDDI